jgi:TetR/AcrR family transcriptional regulator, repressor for uid operon
MRTVDPEKVAKQQREIVLAAIRTFSRLGLERSSTDDICQEAGVSPGRLYYYFKSKDALLDEVTRYFYGSALSASAAYFREESLASAIHDAFRTTQSYLRQIGVSNGLVLEMLASAERNSKLRDQFRDGQERWMKIIEAAIHDQKHRGILRPETDAKSLALAIASVVTGAQALSVVSDRFSDDKIKGILSMLVEPWLTATAQPKKGARARRRVAAAGP